MKVLQLLPIGNLDGGLLMELGPALGDAFHIPCKMMPRPLDPEIAFHRERQQYHSSELLCQMQGYVREDCGECAAARIKAAYTIGDEAPEALQLIKEVIE